MSSSLEIDFTTGPWKQRRLSSHSKKQPLARAVGFPGEPPRIFDATAGLAKDAFLLACLGCEVTCMERVGEVQAALLKAVERGRQDSETAEVLERMQFLEGDSREFLREHGGAFDVIYIDPMFPAKKKSALPPGDMQWLQRVAGKDEDAGELLGVALGSGVGRVVVKRPVHAPPLKEGVTHGFTEKLARYDLYIPG